MSNCLDCGEGLGPKNKSGRCRPCGNTFRNADPEFRRKRAEGIRRRFADPLHRKKMKFVIGENARKARQNPLYMSALRRRGYQLAATYLNDPEIRARNIAAIKAAGPKMSDTKLAWCPREWRDEYRRLTIRKRVPTAEARAMILDQIAAEKRKANKLSPFERQDRALASGAKLVANDVRSPLANPADYGEAKWERAAG
jgi:hypothetical protein